MIHVQYLIKTADSAYREFMTNPDFQAGLLLSRWCCLKKANQNLTAWAAEQIRQTRQLPDQCFDKPWYTCQHQAALSVLLCGYIATYWGPGSRESLFTSPVALQQKPEVSGGHSIWALVEYDGVREQQTGYTC